MWAVQYTLEIKRICFEDKIIEASIPSTFPLHPDFLLYHFGTSQGRICPLVKDLRNCRYPFHRSSYGCGGTKSFYFSWNCFAWPFQNIFLGSHHILRGHFKPSFMKICFITQSRLKFLQSGIICVFSYKAGFILFKFLQSGTIIICIMIGPALQEWNFQNSYKAGLYPKFTSYKAGLWSRAGMALPTLLNLRESVSTGICGRSNTIWEYFQGVSANKVCYKKLSLIRPALQVSIRRDVSYYTGYV